MQRNADRDFSKFGQPFSRRSGPMPKAQPMVAIA